MPYKIKKVSGAKRPYKLVNKNTGKIVGSSTSKAMAIKAMRARYAHSKGR